MDRRRRAIREGLIGSADASDEGRVSPTRTARQAVELEEQPKKERGVAYSHSVRRACQHRLVQFIPVRKLSLTGAIATSIAIPFVLMALHYCVFVSGSLEWSRHPMSALLNANSPRSLAAWLSSHLWLLCLTATIFTFRLRKHKLDDYEGEYRLWFWLVFTCIIGSIDSTTRLTELFGAALDRWSQLHIGWTGGAIVQATLATLIGLLGLRLCSELKTVPASLVLWLLGLSCWAGSAALNQSLLRIDMSPAMRDWMKASLWLGGLTSIWLCGLLYLRCIFMEAQQRFLARSIMSGANAVPWRERLSQAMPRMPKFGRRGEAEEADQSQQTVSAPKRKKMVAAAGLGSAAVAGAAAQAGAATPTTANSPSDKTSGARTQPAIVTDAPKPRWGLGRLALRTPKQSAPTNVTKSSSERNDRADRNHRSEDDDFAEQRAAASNTSPRTAAAEAAHVEQEYGKRSGWLGRRPAAGARDSGNEAKDDSKREARATAKPVAQTKDDRKVQRDLELEGEATSRRSFRDRLTWKRKPKSTDTAVPAKSKPKSNAGSDGESAEPKRRWLTVRKPKMPKVALPKARLPKLKMPSFRLPPPQTADGDNGDQNNPRVPGIKNGRQIPSTSEAVPFRPVANNQDNDADNGRGMSKAERKRLRRMQRDDDEGERRAA